LPGFFFEADLRHHFEELVKQSVAEIDHRCAPMIGQNARELAFSPLQQREKNGQQAVNAVLTWSDAVWPIVLSFLDVGKYLGK
jgi:hypothetical protein